MSRARQLADSADLSFDAGISVDGNITFTAGDRVIGNGDEKIKFDSTNQDIEIQTADTVALAINSTQDFGFAKATPSNWASNYVGLNIGSTGTMYARQDGVQIFSLGSNSYYDGSDNKRVGADPVSNMYFYNGEIVFRNAGTGTADSTIAFSESMRIDSSGNLLVGKTAIGQGTAGFEARATGQTFCTDDGNTPFLVNRLTSDGELIQLNKDGTNVGSIGSIVGDLFIGESDTAVRFDAENNAITPFDIPILDTNDAAIDLGVSSGRFKDLYLSGGVYLGGTGAANYLDDYEEGTWTPVYEAQFGAVSVTYTHNVGKFTRIGNIVHVQFSIRTSSFSAGTGSGSMYLGDLPFTVNSTNDSGRSGGSVGYGADFVSNNPSMLRAQNGDDQLAIFYRTSANGNPVGLAVSDMSTSANKNFIIGSCVYII